MTSLILSPTVELERVVKADRSIAAGLSPWRESYIHGTGVDGAALKKGKWDDYYGMYKTHTMVRAAIDKLAKSATNVGFDFVPRDSRSEVSAEEVGTLKDFFAQQPDFIYELRRVYKDLMIYGDAYIYIIPDRRRRPTRLKRLHPKTIQIKTNVHGDPEKYIQTHPDGVQQDFVTYRPQEIIHFRMDDPDSDIYGLSPLESLKLSVAADLYAQKYNAAFFQNSGVTGTIIGIRNANPSEVDRNRRWLEENYIGPGSAHKPIIIEGESVTISKSVATHQEMGFLEGRRFIIQEILAVLDVPPAKVGIMESANRSNSKEQDKSFRQESISPMQYIVEAAINGQFIRPILGVENTVFRHQVGDNRDALEQIEYYERAARAGFVNIDEVRADMGKAPTPGGHIHTVSTSIGLVPVNKIEMFFDPPDPSQDPRVAADVTREINEKNPTKEKPDKVTAISRSLSEPLINLQGAVYGLMKPQLTDIDLAKAYSYLHSASEIKNPLIGHAFFAVGQAVREDDEYLKKGYVERARDSLRQYMDSNDPQFAKSAEEDEEA